LAQILTFLQAELQTIVLNKLEDVDLQAIPVILKFLMQCAAENTVREIIQKTREKLDLDEISEVAKLQSMQSAARSKGKGRDMSSIPEILILGKFIFEFIFEELIHLFRRIEGRTPVQPRALGRVDQILDRI
jgi:hypothetical protein